MNENNIPKWQRELRSFLGIKSGIILEGNVYDEYPRFSYSAEGAAFLDMDNLDQAVLSLVDEASTALYFFDPVDGFYCYETTLEAQRDALKPLFEGYSTREVTKTTIAPSASCHPGRHPAARDSRRPSSISGLVRSYGGP